MVLHEGFNRLHQQALPAYLKKNRTTIEVALTYPLSWKVECHPLSQEMEPRTKKWLREIGVVQSADQEERLRKLTVSSYAGLPFPRCSEERFEVLMRFLTLWILYDDLIEEKDDGIRDQIQAAVGGRAEVFSGSTPYYRGLWELAQRYSQAMSRPWMDRHAAHFGEWLRSVPEEFDASRRLRENGIYPSAGQHLKCRAIGAGMIVVLNLIEYAIGWELPNEMLRDFEFVILWQLSGEVVALAHDLYSFGKDLRQRWCNIVSCLAQQFHVPLEEAFQWVVAMHNARIRDIELVELGLLAKAPEPEPFRRWLEGLHHALYGLARWHEVTARYTNVQEMGDGQRIRVSVREIP